MCDRFILIGLLLFLGDGYTFYRTGIYHLLQLFFAIYILSIRPFLEPNKNRTEVVKNVFLLVLTYFICILFVAPDKYEVRYACGFVCATFVILVIVVNLVWYIIERIIALKK